MHLIWNRVTWYSKTLAIIVVALTAMLVAYFVQEYKEIQNIKAQTITLVDSGNISTWQTYTNTDFGIEFKYPSTIFETPYIEQDKNNPEYPRLIMKYIIESPDSADIIREGLKINFEKIEDYEYYKNAYDKYPNIYEPFILDGRNGYKELDNTYGVEKREVEGKNILDLFKTDTEWLIRSIYMNVYDHGYRNGFDGGILIVSDRQNNELFKLIISTFKFIGSESGNNQISEQMILDALNKSGGCGIKGEGQNVLYTKSNAGFGCSIPGVTTLYADNFYYGDVNGDGYEDVIFVEGSCGASCGNSLSLGINEKDGTIKIIGLTVPGWVSSSAVQSSLKDITIQNGLINITANGYSNAKNWEETLTKRFRFKDNNLVEIK